MATKEDKIFQSLTGLSNDVKNLTKNVSGLSTEVAGVKGDIAGVKKIITIEVQKLELQTVEEINCLKIKEVKAQARQDAIDEKFKTVLDKFSNVTILENKDKDENKSFIQYLKFWGPASAVIGGTVYGIAKAAIALFSV